MDLEPVDLLEPPPLLLGSWSEFNPDGEPSLEEMIPRVAKIGPNTLGEFDPTPALEIPVLYGEEYRVSSDGVEIYHKEIMTVNGGKLLTAKQEVDFAKAMELGKAAAGDLSLDPTERENLVWQGQEAARELTEANLRLVASVARKYQNRGVALLDLKRMRKKIWWKEEEEHWVKLGKSLESAWKESGK